MRRKTARMRKLERAHNQTIAQLLRDLYAKTGSVTGVAEHLNVSVSTVSNWLARFDIPTRATITPSEFLSWDEPGSSPNGG